MNVKVLGLWFVWEMGSLSLSLNGCFVVVTHGVLKSIMVWFVTIDALCNQMDGVI